MSRVRTVFVCRDCGAETLRWEGRCPTCGEWNSLDEIAAAPGRGRSREAVAGNAVPRSRPRPLAESGAESTQRLSAGFGDVDRVLGGGLVRGSVVLLGGAPGIGKSTLLLQLAGFYRAAGLPVLYVSGEESAEQVAIRAARLGTASEVDFLASGDLDEILAAMRAAGPAVMCVDSIQAVRSLSLGSAAGGIAQVREAADALQREAKATGVATFLVGHVTKGGALAGPRALEHLVDVVLHFEGQRSGEHRLLRGSKNRFGSVDEVAAFRMDATGLLPVPDPSALFLSEGAHETSGAALAVPLHGSRPLLAEVQALVARARFSSPQRICTGFPPRRLSILLAVLERRAGMGLSEQDVFLNVVGGLRMSDPAVDLAVIAALVSAGADRPFDPGIAFLGEVGLGGEVRGVSHVEARVRVCLGAGLRQVVAPATLVSDIGRDERVTRINHVREVHGLLRSEDGS
jgi:DNA repair protein RadA/Sms